MYSLLFMLFILGICIDAELNTGPCYQHSCVNGGTCIPQGSSYRCECPEDYVEFNCYGVRSPTIHCQLEGPSQCYNGGICNTTHNKFLCDCPSTFTGVFCETDVNECLDSPCRNGGICVNQIGNFQCICPKGFIGARCELPVEVCSLGTCHNGGSCINSVGGYVCACPDGFTGKRCQYKNDDSGLTRNTTRSNLPHVCTGCFSEADGSDCDEKCGRIDPEFAVDDSSVGDLKPLAACPTPIHCARVFRNHVCDKTCDTEVCLFDGFDCLANSRKCAPSCQHRRDNGICDKDCNTEECDYDGGECIADFTKVLSGELSVVVLAKPSYFLARIPYFLRSLSKMVRADIQIKSDEKGQLIFLWKDEEIGERVIAIDESYRYAHSTIDEDQSVKEGVLVWVEVDVSRCSEECFDDIEIVASFIESAKNELKDMTIYSAVATKPKYHQALFYVIFVIALVIGVAVLFAGQQRGQRKRKIIENAPVWIPPKEFEIGSDAKVPKKKQRRSRQGVKRIPSGPEDFCDEVTSKLPRVYTLPKPRKLEPEPSKLHMEAESAAPLSLFISSEEANKRGPLGRTPLMMLVRNTFKSESQLIEDVNKLYAAGADLNLCDNYDDTALHTAVYFGRVELVQRMIRLGASPIIRDRTNSTCLHLAARACASQMVSVLLEVDDMRRQIDAVDDDSRTALMLTAMHDYCNTNVAAMLCGAGAKVDYDGDRCLPTWKGRTALHYAAKYGNQKITTFLLENGADKDGQDYECCTALHLAASEGHVECVKQLLSFGASVLLRNDKNQTAYDMALINNCHEVVEVLASADNLRVHLYGNHGELFPSSCPPSFKCTKLLMARHSQLTSDFVTVISPRSTQSTSLQVSAQFQSTSPYNRLNLPYSLAVFEAPYPSPQLSAATLKSTDTLKSNSRYRSPAAIPPSQNSQSLITRAPLRSVILNPPYSGEPHPSSVGTETMGGISGYSDSGLGTMTDSGGVWPAAELSVETELDKMAHILMTREKEDVEPSLRRQKLVRPVDLV